MRSLPSKTGRPLVIAHRGAKAYKPENTLAAFALAVEQGADMIETDLHLTRDKAVPISHDATLERFGREGEIADVELEELRSISLASHDPEKHKGAYEGIPTLAEMLDRFGEVIPFNLEIKTTASHKPYPGLQKMALDHVVERGLLDRTLFSSFSDAVLAELRELEPRVRLGVLEEWDAPEGIFDRAEAVAAESINPYFVNVTTELVERAHDKNLAVYVYTVNEIAKMEELLAMGVDGIISNKPDALKTVVDGR